MYEIVSLVTRPEMKMQMAEWFHAKWSVPLEAYVESMDECLRGNAAVPQWYVAVDNGRIIGGMGVIENDFHARKDLAPNVCAVYTEEDRRNEGIAGRLLGYVCDDMKAKGIDTLYLITDHVGFYERYGWEYLCMTECDGEEAQSRVYVHNA